MLWTRFRLCKRTWPEPGETPILKKNEARRGAKNHTFTEGHGEKKKYGTRKLCGQANAIKAVRRFAS